MRFRAILSMATLFMTCFTIAVFTQPLQALEAGRRADAVPENQSVSGKISSVKDAVFQVNVTKGTQAAQNVEFQLDDKTKVEGKLTLGASVMVEYRSDSGKNIAVHVVVTPASDRLSY